MPFSVTALQSLEGLIEKPSGQGLLSNELYFLLIWANVHYLFIFFQHSVPVYLRLVYFPTYKLYFFLKNYEFPFRKHKDK